MPFLAIATAAYALQAGDTPSPAFLIFQINDIACFSVTFGLAVWWRSKPERHRRLVLMAACCLTSEAFGRFPDWLLPVDFPWFYAGVDLLILMGVTRDLLVQKRVHPVYGWGLPAMAMAQTGAMAIYLSGASGWLAIVRAFAQHA